MAAPGRIDVVIPVYNAPDFTRVCIESLYARVEPLLESVYVHDNASQPDTARMLDSLRFPRLRVHHAPVNTGFGDAVNQGVAQTRTEWVLVLNSDTRADSDFLSPLIAAMRHDEKLAAVTPGGITFARYDLSQYVQRAGCAVTHNLYGYAFLLRRAAFEAVQRFDPIFGLGYYEDSDLSRKLIRAGYWLGVHARSELHHEIHGSFKDVPTFRELMGKNREIYFGRYPDAGRRVLCVSRTRRLEDLPTSAIAQAELVLEAGGNIHWVAPRGPERLLAMNMHSEAGGTARALSLLWRRRGKHHGEINELWLMPDAPAGVGLVERLARRQGARVQRFESERGAATSRPARIT